MWRSSRTISRFVSSIPGISLTPSLRVDLQPKLWPTGSFINLSTCSKICAKNVATIQPEATATLGDDNILSAAPSTVVASTSINSYTDRTHNCGQLNLSHAGQPVQLCGWLQFQRMRMFLTLRDSYGETQCIVPDHLIEQLRLDTIPFESILRIVGHVQPRPPAQQNPRMPTGDIEVVVDALEILNTARPQLPMEVRHHNRAGETTRLKYRYMDLRFADMQRNLRRRSATLHRMRRFLVEHAGFLEVETPTLFRRTPGGAQEFVVPTRRAGQFYSLVQSPQQFKQMLMAGAVDRYFQVARCYRDESTRPDRQPEFTQLDIELSFSNPASIMRLIEDLLTDCWPTATGSTLRTPFPRITYAQAMSEYGCDKPDTRFGMKIQQVRVPSAPGRTFHAIVMPETTRGKFPVSLTEAVNERCRAAVGDAEDAMPPPLVLQINREPSTWCAHNRVDGLSVAQHTELFAALGVQRGWTVLLANPTAAANDGDVDAVRTTLGQARLAAMDFLEANGLTATPRSKDAFEFLWVVDFPLFAMAKSSGLPLETVHHPFTAPHPDDVHLLDDPAARTRIRSQAYDLVLNGQEVGGGSVRIHDELLQRRVLEEILCIRHEHLAHLLDALATGCPPHGGIALGVDRLMAILCAARSIRDVIAFPKAADGRDALSKAPVPVSEAELELYHIRVRE